MLPVCFPCGFFSFRFSGFLRVCFHADDSRRPELTLCQNDKKSVRAWVYLSECFNVCPETFDTFRRNK